MHEKWRGPEPRTRLGASPRTRHSLYTNNFLVTAVWWKRSRCWLLAPASDWHPHNLYTCPSPSMSPILLRNIAGTCTSNSQVPITQGCSQAVEDLVQTYDSHRYSTCTVKELAIEPLWYTLAVFTRFQGPNQFSCIFIEAHKLVQCILKQHSSHYEATLLADHMFRCFDSWPK